jgi:division protein CdvB (Snf7/Vps24/ESCRT-III family)
MITKKELEIVQNMVEVSIKKGMSSMEGALVEAVEQRVQKTVNGKIDKLSNDFANYRGDDEKWKREVQPAIESMKTLKLGYKIGGVLLILIAGAAAFLANIKPILALTNH